MGAADVKPPVATFPVGPALVVEAALVAVLGAIGLGSASFWHDEAFTSAMVELPLDELARVAWARELNQAPWYFVLRPWAAVLGTGEAALRAASVLAAVASVVLLVLAGRRLVGARAAVAAGLVLAVNPFFVAYAQEARSYTATVAVVLAATLALCRAIERPGPGPVLVYAGMATLAVYLHFFAGLVVAAQVVGVVVARLPWRRLVPAWAAVAVALVPVAVFVAGVDAADVDTVTRPTPGSALDVAASAAGGPALLVALGALATVGLLGRWRLAATPVLVAWVVLPAAATYAVSVTAKPLLVDRFLIVALPAVVLLAGAGLARLRPALGALALVAVLALSGTALSAWYRDPGKADWRAASAWVLGHHRPGDGIVFFRPHVRTTFAYYNARAGSPVAEDTVLSPPPSWRLGDLKADVPAFDAAAVAAAAAEHPRLWAFFTHLPGPGPFGDEAAVVVDALATRYHQVGRQSFGNLTLVVYERSQPGAGPTRRR